MTVEDAIKLAMDRVRTLFDGSDHRLEEIEVLDNGDFIVTISYRSPDAPRPLSLGRESITSGLTESYFGRKAAIGIDASRTYKDVSISKDGVVKRVSMRHIVLG